MAHRIIWLTDNVFEELKDYIISGNYSKENSITLNKFIFMPERLNNMTDKPKVTLTRQAAADMLRRHTLEGFSNVDNMINFYVEAGMLKVVEEKEELPAFEIIEPDGNHIKIYKNGQIQGILGMIINRIGRA